MSSETIWARMRQQPFNPFKLNTSDGKSYEVYHPENIYVSKNRIIVSRFRKGEKPGQDLASDDVFISPLHVTSIEDVRQRTKSRSA